MEIYGTSAPKLELLKYDILRKTLKGFWIVDPVGHGKDKWVNNYANKRFAYLTPEAALIAFQARKKRQISILSAQLANAKEDLQLVQKDINKIISIKKEQTA